MVVHEFVVGLDFFNFHFAYLVQERVSVWEHVEGKSDNTTWRDLSDFVLLGFASHHLFTEHPVENSETLLREELRLGVVPVLAVVYTVNWVQNQVGVFQEVLTICQCGAMGQPCLVLLCCSNQSWEKLCSGELSLIGKNMIIEILSFLVVNLDAAYNFIISLAVFTVFLRRFFELYVTVQIVFV
jgi:hypothetical protein